MSTFHFFIFGLFVQVNVFGKKVQPNKNPPTLEPVDGNHLDWLETSPGDPDPKPRSLIGPLPKILPTDTNLIKFLYYPNITSDGIEIKLDDAKSLDASNIVKKIELKVLTHGFLSNARSKFPRRTKDFLLETQNGKCNVIVVDWGPLAANNEGPALYSLAVQNVYIVGNHLGNFLVFLLEKGVLASYDDVHLIGFSLGSHVSAVAANKILTRTKFQIGRITGLDPAGPEFGNGQPDFTKKLDKGDAKFVDVVHTNAGIYGTVEASGHVDFYANGGGKSQPHCLLFSCAHSFAHEIFADSIHKPASYIAIACKCEPWNWNQNGECKTNCTNALTVGLSTSTTSSGSYFFRMPKITFE